VKVNGIFGKIYLHLIQGSVCYFLFDPEERGDIFFRNTGQFPQDYMAHQRRYSSTEKLEPEFSPKLRKTI
jgi:hypothetical protein